jgi:integral membrane sensor domain MASE1
MPLIPFALGAVIGSSLVLLFSKKKKSKKEK